MVLGKSRLLPGFVAVVILGGGLYLAFALTRPPAAGRVDTQLVTGRQLYVAHCASCHGANLEGQANWQTRRPDGKLPAPPHDATGHTWHHADRVLFDITRQGPAAYPSGYRTDMPAFGDMLGDEDIAAVLAFIKSTWPDEIRRRQPKARN